MIVDHRKDIPLGCIINKDIINFLRNKPAFRSACIQVPKLKKISNENNEEWPFFNISFGFYLMYCLLVVPKELNKLSPDSSFYKKIHNESVLRNFKIILPDTGDVPAHEMFRFLRNAVAHVNYSIDENDNIEFWNNRGNGEENWRVSITHGDMVSFLQEIEIPVIKLMRDST